MFSCSFLPCYCVDVSELLANVLFPVFFKNSDARILPRNQYTFRNFSKLIEQNEANGLLARCRFMNSIDRFRLLDYLWCIGTSYVG